VASVITLPGANGDHAIVTDSQHATRDSRAALHVVVADAGLASRGTIRRLLEEGRCSICGEAADAETAIKIVRKQQPEIALVDVGLPGTGIRAAAEIAALPDVQVVMLATAFDEHDLLESLRLGASGYLVKDADLGRLADVLWAVHGGEIAVPRRLVARVIAELRSRDSSARARLVSNRAAGLTDREWEVLELLAEGLTTAEIAERNFVAPVTVRSQVSSILKKLGVPDRAAAIDLLTEIVGRTDP
jgi:DNA-binding NarL/FixJ family response regulator